MAKPSGRVAGSQARVTGKAPGQILTASAHPCYSNSLFSHWLLNRSQWMSASSRVMVLQLLLFLFSVPPQSKISHRSCVQPLFHTFRHSSLLNTSLNGFNLFLFKIMLFLNHQKHCLCQIQLVLSLSNSPASRRRGLPLLLLR